MALRSGMPAAPEAPIADRKPYCRAAGKSPNAAGPQRGSARRSDNSLSASESCLATDGGPSVGQAGMHEPSCRLQRLATEPESRDHGAERLRLLLQVTRDLGALVGQQGVLLRDLVH